MQSYTKLQWSLLVRMMSCSTFTRIIIIYGSVVYERSLFNLHYIVGLRIKEIKYKHRDIVGETYLFIEFVDDSVGSILIINCHSNNGVITIVHLVMNINTLSRVVIQLLERHTGAKKSTYKSLRVIMLFIPVKDYVITLSTVLVETIYFG